jgi:3-methyladenine DNA glycosylase AlkD
MSMSSNNNEASSASSDPLPRRITADLEAAGIAAKKAWWERYLKHQITFYGVPMGDIRQIINEYDDGAITKQTAWELFQGDVAEQKLAAILILQKLKLAVADLRELEKLFRDRHIDDWNTTDWLCVKTLGDLVSMNDAAVQVMQNDWSSSSTTSLWQKRASLVAFVNHSSHPAVLSIARTILLNSRSEDRFIMTAIGWVLRNRSETEPEVVLDFLRTHDTRLSEEAKNMMTAKMNDRDRRAAGRPGKRQRR